MKTLAAAVLFSLALAPLNAQITMNIAYEDKEQPPYYMGNTSNVLDKNPGVAVELVKMLESKIPGLTITLTRAPWARCTAGLGNNEYDGIFNASYSADRLSLGWYPTTDATKTGPVDVTKRITTISYSLYVPKTSTLGWDGKAFSNLTGSLGAPRGYSVVKDLKAKGLDVVEVQGTNNALEMLAIGRLPGVALQDVTADDIIRKYPERFGNLMKLPVPIVSKPYYLMLSRAFVSDNPALAQKIWQAIKELREAQFDAVAAKYAD